MKTVIAEGPGECVYGAGTSDFLRLAEAAGWRTVFLGPATSVEAFLEAIRHESPGLSLADELLVGVSYRLIPETGGRLLGKFVEGVFALQADGVRFAFAGTLPVAARAQELGFFEKIFDGSKAS